MITISIVGRPNVGKSTLFNILVRKRLAITHAEAGVTRDLKKIKITKDNREFEIIDTGGITNDGVFSQQISKLSFQAINFSNLVILLVSAEEITAEDEELISYCRKLTIPVLLVVNKVDNEQREWQSNEYAKYGFGFPVMISAVHRKNIDLLWHHIFELLENKVTDTEISAGGRHIEKSSVKPIEQSVMSDVDSTTSTSDVKQTTSTSDVKQTTSTSDVKQTTITSEKPELDTVEPITQRPIRVLIMGKPNSGKSSLLNALLGKERVLVSEIPGTTRDIIEEETELFGEKIILVDSAGIRRKNKIEEDIEYYASHRAISEIANCDVVILLVDVNEGLSEQDKKIASLIIRDGKGLIISLSKWDLLEVTNNRLTAEKDRIKFLVPQLHFVNVCPISAKTKYGLALLIKEVKNVFLQLNTRINSSKLNRNLEQWVQKKESPIVRKKRGKIKFMYQTSVNPVIFQAKVNNPNLFNEAYMQYIINNIRSSYKLKNIPIQLELLHN